MYKRLFLITLILILPLLFVGCAGQSSTVSNSDAEVTEKKFRDFGFKFDNFRTRYRLLLMSNGVSDDYLLLKDTEDKYGYYVSKLAPRGVISIHFYEHDDNKNLFAIHVTGNFLFEGVMKERVFLDSLNIFTWVMKVVDPSLSESDVNSVIGQLAENPRKEVTFRKLKYKLDIDSSLVKLSVSP